jgi:6-phosphogluconolactonase
MEVFPTTEVAAEVAAHEIARLLRQGLAERGRASLVATGGRSPGPVYDRLREAADLDWARVVVTLSDERCVGEADPASNAGLVRRRLMQGRAAHARLLPLWPEPQSAALDVLSPFDAVMLGMGEDGHIASLLPGDPALADGLDLASPRRVARVPEGLGKPPLARITLTLAVLTAARAVFLLIAGEAKREVIARAQRSEGLPVRALIAQTRVPVRILWSPAHEE